MLKVYCLQDSDSQQSKLLPDLDLTLIARYVVIEDPLDAVVQWREAIAN